jgi:anti-sigma regulatory factor (Ser/Thr protein kinase)
MAHAVPAFELEVPAEAARLTDMRWATSDWAQTVGIPPSRLDDVRTAVGEAAANVVRHAYSDPPGPLMIRGFAEDAHVRMVVIDHGRGLKRAAAEGTPDGLGFGMGLPLMRLLADEVIVSETPGGGCTIELVYAISRQSE